MLQVPELPGWDRPETLPGTQVLLLSRLLRADEFFGLVVAEERKRTTEAIWRVAGGGATVAG